MADIRFFRRHIRQSDDFFKDRRVRNLAPLAASWEQDDRYAFVSSISDSDAEARYAHELALCDASHLQRIGFKGNGTAEWLARKNVAVPTQINTAVSLKNGALVARLGINDILIMDSLHQGTNIPIDLEQQWHADYARSNGPCGFIMPRQDSHACFYLSGNHASEMFSTLCAVDLRAHKFSNHSIAQTLLARLSAIVIRHDIGNTMAFLVLVENVTAEYCWDCLYDAMQEFHGQIVGTRALTTLMQENN